MLEETFKILDFEVNQNKLRFDVFRIWEERWH